MNQTPKTQNEAIPFRSGFALGIRRGMGFEDDVVSGHRFFAHLFLAALFLFLAGGLFFVFPEYFPGVDWVIAAQ